MQQSSLRSYWDEAATVAERSQARHLERIETRERPVGPVVPPRSSEAEWSPLRDQIVAGARALAEQMRALQARYQAEHRHLADTLEFLSVQSHDLERELAEFSHLADRLELDVLAVRDSHGGTGRVVSTPPHEAGARLEVRCLGGFDVRYRGRPLDLGSSRNGRAIFKYLAICAPGRRASKEVLAELFWPDVPLDRALASLQSAVHQLRRAVGRCAPELVDRPLIIFRADQYGLDPRLEVTSDVDRFRRRLADARALEVRGRIDAACQAYGLALEAYGGELLPDDRYEDWAATERASLEAERSALLTHLVRLHLAGGEYQEASHFGRRLVELDETREDVHRDLMRCYSRLGQRSEALRQYRRCVEVLSEQLDLEPEPETTELYEQVMRGRAI